MELFSMNQIQYHVWIVIYMEFIYLEGSNHVIINIRENCYQHATNQIIDVSSLIINILINHNQHILRPN
jgi:hypothetical protein